jgi:hypothetical protein
MLRRELEAAGADWIAQNCADIAVSESAAAHGASNDGGGLRLSLTLLR